MLILAHHNQFVLIFIILFKLNDLKVIVRVAHVVCGTKGVKFSALLSTYFIQSKMQKQMVFSSCEIFQLLIDVDGYLIDYRLVQVLYKYLCTYQYSRCFFILTYLIRFPNMQQAFPTWKHFGGIFINKKFLEWILHYWNGHAFLDQIKAIFHNNL